MRMILAGAAGFALVAAAAPAAAATYVVEAQANSFNGGTALNSITIAAGRSFRVSSGTNDLWSAGALPRYSDANGLVFRTATASDDSGQPVGSQIGANFGPYSDSGLSTLYGTLVGQFGSDTPFAIGANNTLVASGSGVLKLFYWDSNAGDNFGDITFQIAEVPEPATWAMMIGGVGLAGGALRRRRAVRGHVRFA